MKGEHGILSYYYESDGKIHLEFLNDHVKRALDYIEFSRESKLFKFSKNLLPPEVDIYDLSRLSIIFHDTGKIFYQKMYRSLDGGKYISFRGHEYFSSYIFEKFLKETIDQNLNRNVNMEIYNYYNICSFAILFHHHAMNVNLRKPPKSVNKHLQYTLKIIDGLKFLNTFLLDSEKPVFNSVIERLKKEISYSFFYTEMIRYIDKKMVDLWRMVMTYPKYKKMSLMLLSILLTADNLAARELRGYGGSRFHMALKDFYNYYLKP
ncbi:MAG: CRISPR-associated endonuclease Cas3'' [archaeon GB-1845-036]|nr:CRISPR-associated endonuclease Cas3'' [Candidatus Culexmicrobium thermophilum]